jgi:hypothetical protein
VVDDIVFEKNCFVGKDDPCSFPLKVLVIEIFSQVFINNLKAIFYFKKKIKNEIN